MTGSKQGGPGAQLGKLRIHRGRAERSAHAADRSREFAGCEGRALELADQTPAMRPGGAGAAVSARNEARQGRCRQQRLACPAKEKPTGERTVAECLSRMFPRTSLTPGFRIGTQRKDFICAMPPRGSRWHCEREKSQIWDFWELWDATVFSSRIRANGIFTGGSDCIC